MHPPGQRELRRRAAASRGRARSGREQPGAEVATGPQHLGGDREGAGQDDVQQQSHQRGSDHAETRVFQPNGVSQPSHSAPTSPTARIR